LFPATPAEIKSQWNDIMMGPLASAGKSSASTSKSATVPSTPSALKQSSIFAMYGLDSPCSAIPPEVSSLVENLVSAPAAKKQKKPSAPLRMEGSTNVTAPAVSLHQNTSVPEAQGPSPQEGAPGFKKFFVTFATSQSYVCMLNDTGSKSL
jgi:hypothetical protein